MIRDINKDIFSLSIPSSEATKEDVSIAQDLMDTLNAHKLHCVGMAANMIGKNKRIIAFFDENEMIVMLNPKYMDKKGGTYQVNEGCLSLDGTRETTRYRCVKVFYYDMHFKKKIKTFYDFSAQIIQHEMDHLEGIII